MLAVTPHSVGLDAIIQIQILKRSMNNIGKQFTRTVEDFVCAKCGREVKGSGYTNHCPNCLWSKHVDVNPGDRADDCGGMMKPVSYQKIGGKEKILHQCQVCGFERINKVEKEDNIEAILKI